MAEVRVTPDYEYPSGINQPVRAQYWKIEGFSQINNLKIRYRKSAVSHPISGTTNKSALEQVEKEFPKLSQSCQKVLARKMALLDKLKVLPLTTLHMPQAAKLIGVSLITAHRWLAGKKIRSHGIELGDGRKLWRWNDRDVFGK